MKKYLNIALACLAGIAMTACVDHVPSEEALPTQKIDFAYEVIGERYQLDYYVGSTIQFYPTMEVTTSVEWDFGDGSPVETGKIVEHKYTLAGNYKVTAKGNGGVKTNVIYIADIRPIVSLNLDEATTPEGIVEVSTSYISLNVELPNPDSLAAKYVWTFPAGTTDEGGNEVSNFEQFFPENSTTPDKVLGKVKFAKVGSQTVKLQVKLETNRGTGEYRDLDIVNKNVQVALSEPAPTLYFVVKDGTINAIKIPASRKIEGVTIEPYDMGVSSGQHMLNICYDDSLIYLLDCGKQFVYCNDVDGTMGDGRMNVMSVDASSVGLVITNVGGTAFKDPFYGFIEGDYIYFSDRNTGFRKLNKNTRNAVWSSSVAPSYVENNWIGYYGTTSMIYGSFNACFGRIDGVWHWCKKGNGAGCWRFTDADNNGSGRTDWKMSEIPASGQLFEGTPTTAFVYDKNNDKYYFAFTGPNEGFYGFNGSEINTFSPQIGDAGLSAFQAGQKKFADGTGIKPHCATTNAGSGEGGVDEYVGVSQMALDEATGDVYFMYRSSVSSQPSGLVRYNAELDQLEYVVSGIQGYGVAVSPIMSKLFK